MPQQTRSLIDRLRAIPPEQRAEALRTLPADAIRALDLETAALAATMGTPADYAERNNPSYTRPAHVDLIAQAIKDTVEEANDGTGTGRLIINTPPRVGKSTTTSLWTPAWFLERWPDRSVILATHTANYSVSWGRKVRDLLKRLREDGSSHVDLDPSTAAAGEWETTRGGGMLSTGVGGAITGRGAHLLIIDDPIRGFVEAHSQGVRQSQWDWWLSDASTRLEPGAAVVVLMCMTGDTPVLRPDGTTTPLRQIRPGDAIATYENGSLTTSTVRNWANQGPDDVLSIRMTSGRVVRANARHPFLTVDENGVETWQRTDTLRPGSRILTATGASGGGLPAPRMAAANLRSARACVCRTTARLDELLGIDPRRPTPMRTGPHASSTATGSPLRSTTAWSPSRRGSVPSVGTSLLTARPTGAESSASTTTTRPELCAACCATTATSSSSGTSRPNGSALPARTWNVTPDTVAEVVPAGREDVFDLQVERTENFIANGLVSHNTRWHEDDLVGRLLSHEHEGDPNDWRVMRFPALGEGPTTDTGIAPDALNRDVDEPLIQPQNVGQSVEEARAMWKAHRRARGPYIWAGLYQQRPSEPEGTILKRAWWQFYLRDADFIVLPDGSRIPIATMPLVQSWDLAFKGLDTSDWVVGQVWGTHGADRFLLDQWRDRADVVETLAGVKLMRARWPRTATTWIEDAANGPAVVSMLKREVSGLNPRSPQGDKRSRAWAVQGTVESGNVWLPAPEQAEWVRDLIEECAAFPNGAHDDQVDALTQALINLAARGTSSIEVPGGTKAEGSTRQLQTTRRQISR